jgi:hypothetical protein
VLRRDGATHEALDEGEVVAEDMGDVGIGVTEPDDGLEQFPVGGVAASASTRKAPRRAVRMASITGNGSLRSRSRSLAPSPMKASRAASSGE